MSSAGYIHIRSAVVFLLHLGSVRSLVYRSWRYLLPSGSMLVGYDLIEAMLAIWCEFLRFKCSCTCICWGKMRGFSFITECYLVVFFEGSLKRYFLMWLFIIPSEIGRKGSGPMGILHDPFFASSSASSLPYTPSCPGKNCTVIITVTKIDQFYNSWTTFYLFTLQLHSACSAHLH